MLDAFRDCCCFCVSACDCNRKSSDCYFDAELYRATGHGGHCRNCADNTDGPNCERCLDNYHRDQSGNRCLPCNCNSIGESRQLAAETANSSFHPGSERMKA